MFFKQCKTLESCFISISIPFYICRNTGPTLHSLSHFMAPSLLASLYPLTHPRLLAPVSSFLFLFEALYTTCCDTPSRALFLFLSLLFVPREILLAFCDPLQPCSYNVSFDELKFPRTSRVVVSPFLVQFGELQRDKPLEESSELKIGPWILVQDTNACFLEIMKHIEAKRISRCSKEQELGRYFHFWMLHFCPMIILLWEIIKLIAIRRILLSRCIVVILKSEMYWLSTILFLLRGHYWHSIEVKKISKSPKLRK